GTAPINGTIKDDLGNFVTGIGSSAQDQPDHVYEADGRSVVATPTNYSIAVIAGTNWSVQPSSDDLAALGYLSSSRINTNIAAGQAIRADFVVQRVTTHITGTVRDGAGNPLPNLDVYAHEDNSNYNVNGTTDG